MFPSSEQKLRAGIIHSVIGKASEQTQQPAAVRAEGGCKPTAVAETWGYGSSTASPTSRLLASAGVAQQEDIAFHFLQRLVASQEQLACATQRARTKNLIDSTGFRKPPPFNSNQVHFQTWSRKPANFTCSIHADVEEDLLSSSQRKKSVHVATLRAELY